MTGVVSKRWYHRGTCEGFEGRRESMESSFCHVGEVGDDREGGIKVSGPLSCVKGGKILISTVPSDR